MLIARVEEAKGRLGSVSEKPLPLILVECSCVGDLVISVVEMGDDGTSE